jgi:hypothetical protein
MEKTWKDAITKVLSESAEPLHYTEIAERILSRGYYETDSATPAATVNALIASSIAHDGERSPFIRVARGTFALRNATTLVPEAPAPSTATIELTNLTEAAVESSNAIIRSLGMYWQRDLVVWRREPRLYGKQPSAAKAVDFSSQRGIYILYDHHTVAYVGRCTDRPLGKRLFEHTIDRLNSRWNRFSWFGLLDVTDQGDLIEVALNTSLASLIATLEALLIEALEPPQNRKRGEDFSAIEYIQDVDSELKEREIQNTMRAIEERLRGGS